MLSIPIELVGETDAVVGHDDVCGVVEDPALHHDTVIYQLRSFHRSSNRTYGGGDGGVCGLAFDDDGAVLFGDGQAIEASAQFCSVHSLC